MPSGSNPSRTSIVTLGPRSTGPRRGWLTALRQWFSSRENESQQTNQWLAGERRENASLQRLTNDEPPLKDFLTVKATLPGFVAYRYPTLGIPYEMFHM